MKFTGQGCKKLFRKTKSSDATEMAPAKSSKMTKGKEKLAKGLGKLIASAKKNADKQDDNATVTVKEDGKDTAAATATDGGNGNGGNEFKVLTPQDVANDEQKVTNNGAGNASSDAAHAEDMTQKIDESFLSEVSGRKVVPGRPNPPRAKGHTRERTQTVDENFLKEIGNEKAAGVRQKKPHPVAGTEAESSRSAGRVDSTETSSEQLSAGELGETTSHSNDQSEDAQNGWKQEKAFWHDVVDNLKGKEREDSA